jgi:NAD(P)-dependent dehydrogenase (short-subunit alcohol dehydrogenase family)
VSAGASPPCAGALVTGAAAGIGLAVDRALVERGTRVAALDVDAQGLADARRTLGEAFYPVAADLAEAPVVPRAVDSAWQALGPLEGVVNCAGIYPVTPLPELEVEEWDRVFAVNLRAPFLVTQAMAGRMHDAAIAGRVVNVSSTAATLCRPGIAHYGASKAGLEQLTRNMALELAPWGIRVNAVAPGLVATRTVREHARGAGRAEHEAKLARIPLGREATPEEIVPLVLTLLSAQTSYCTGSVFLADGGVTLGIPAY